MEFQLTTLGTIALRRPDGTSVESILQQPRRLSLLVFLAIAGRDGMVRRDDIAAMFWPDADAASCRNALSQVLHYLRKSLGADAIITRGNDEIALNPAVVACDAVQLLHGLAAADPRSSGIDSALDLYRGTFMPGLFDAGSASFEQWVEKVRGTLRRAASDAAWVRANALADAGEVVGAAALARRAASWMEADEISLRALMTLLARVGDRVGALDAFERFSRMLEADYEMQPSAETAALAETIREPQPVAATVAATVALEHGGPAMPDVPATEATTVAVRMDTAAQVTAGVSLSAKRRRFPVWAERLATVGGSAVVAGTILVSWAGRTPDDARGTTLPASVMVSRFGYDSSDHALASTGRRLRETLIHNLTGGNLPFPVIDGAAGAGNGSIDVAAGDHFQVIGGITRDDDATPHFTVRVIDRHTSAVINSREFAVDGDIAAVAEEASDFARYVVGAELDVRKHLSRGARELVLTSLRARTVADSLSVRGSADVARLTLNGMDAELASANVSGDAAADVHIERAEIALARMWVTLFDATQPLSSTIPVLRDGLKQVSLAKQEGGRDAKADELAGLLYYWIWSAMPAERGAPLHARQVRDSAVQHLLKAVASDAPNSRAWSTLSALYANDGQYAQAQYAAEKALRADLFARDVSSVRFRLFESALETGHFDTARKACDDIDRTMGSEWWGAYCTIVIIAWTGSTTEQQAGDIRRLLNVAGQDNRPNHDAMKAAAGVALANGGYSNEAASLYEQIESSPMKSEMVVERAWLATALGRSARAQADLLSYVAERPDARAGVLKSRRWQRSTDKPITAAYLGTATGR